RLAPSPHGSSSPTWPLLHHPSRRVRGRRLFRCHLSRNRSAILPHHLAPRGPGVQPSHLGALYRLPHHPEYSLPPGTPQVASRRHLPRPQSPRRAAPPRGPSPAASCHPPPPLLHPRGAPRCRAPRPSTSG